MKTPLMLVLALSVATTSVSAQDTKAPATKQDTKATGTKSVTTKAPTPAATQQDAKTQPNTKAAQGTKTPATQRGLTVAPETAPRAQAPVIMREVFEYASEGRRDPFVSLIATSELRPTVADLRLTSVLYDPSGRRSVAVMRDLVTNTQYRVTTGMTLGRMRVALIKRRAVIFSIEEFGLNRQDSLVLGDTTKVRPTR
jgi:hypothetical protein